MSVLNKSNVSGFNPCVLVNGVPTVATISYQPALGTSGSTAGVTAIHKSGKTVCPANGSPSSTDVADDTTQQAATTLAVGTDADNFLPSTASLPTATGAIPDSGVPKQNSAQSASQGLSLSPQHE